MGPGGWPGVRCPQGWWLLCGSELLLWAHIWGKALDQRHGSGAWCPGPGFSPVPSSQVDRQVMDLPLQLVREVSVGTDPAIVPMSLPTPTHPKASHR